MRRLIISTLFIFATLFINGQQVVDNGKFLKDSEIKDLIDQMSLINKNTTAQILIYTVMDLEGKSTKDYSIELWKKYPAGLRGINNGVIILLSKNDRKLQITNGYGLEWILSDIESQKIVNEMVPYFKKQEFYNGIKMALSLLNAKFSSYDWNVKPNQLEKINITDNRKIIKFHYTNQTGMAKYKYGIDTDPQFSDEFNITLSVSNVDFTLYYSKYMNELIGQIMTKSNVTIFGRLIDFKTKRLELIGIE